MQNERAHLAIRLTSPETTKKSSVPASLWSHLPAIAKCLIIVPPTMALLGAEVELRLSPQLDVIITVAGVWGFWVWLNGRTYR